AAHGRPPLLPLRRFAVAAADPEARRRRGGLHHRRETDRHAAAAAPGAAARGLGAARRRAAARPRGRGRRLNSSGGRMVCLLALLCLPLMVLFAAWVGKRAAEEPAP